MKDMMMEYLSGLLRIQKEKKFLRWLTSRYSPALEELRKEASLAKKLAEDPVLYILDSGSRLLYVKEKAKSEDPHVVSAILQTVYEVNMNMHQPVANFLLLIPFLGEWGRDLAEELERKGEEIPKGREGGLEELLKMREEEINELFEQCAFTPSGFSSSFWPKGTKTCMKILKRAYLRRFGEVKKPEVRFDPFPHLREMVEDFVRFEMGVEEIPKYELKMSLGMLPFTTKKEIVLSKSSLDSEGSFFNALSNELPHLLMGGEGARARHLQTQKGRREFLRQWCWEEGVATTISERCHKHYYRVHGMREEKAERIAEVAIKEAIEMTPVSTYLLLHAPEIAVHPVLSHYIGWRFVRKIPRKELQEMIRDESAYLSKEFPWNGGEAEEWEQKDVKEFYDKFKELNRKRYPNLTDLLEKSFRTFEEDWNEIASFPLR